MNSTVFSEEVQAEMQPVVDFMRKNGIARIKYGDLFEVEFTAGWAPPVEVANQPESKAESGPVKEPKRGVDGLTAEQQEELYGRVMDAKE